MKLYIIFWKYQDFADEGEGTCSKLDIGYLPLINIPEGSPLREAVFDPNQVLCFSDSGGLKGIYEDQKLAEEHLRIESEWRMNDTLYIQVFEAAFAGDGPDLIGLTRKNKGYRNRL